MGRCLNAVGEVGRSSKSVAISAMNFEGCGLRCEGCG